MLLTLRVLPLCVAVALVTGCEKPSPAPRSAILITLDTTRADAVSCLGGRPGLTPNIDRLAAEGVLYERAFAVAPITAPSHSSMLTGLYPPRHGVRDNGLFRLPDSAVTIAEVARDAGVQTAAFVAASVLEPRFGMAQGFERYDAPQTKTDASGEHGAERPGAEVVEQAIAWLRQRDPKRPFFLWVHLFDPHAPYAPPPELRSGPAGGNPYLGDVALADREIGKLLEFLRRDSALEQAAIVLAGDHGEAFGEHDEYSHGPYVWQTTLHVPLIVRSGARAGQRSRATVSGVDVFATLAELLDLPLPSGVDGVSLVSTDPAEDRGVYFESYTGFLAFEWSQLAGWADRRGKYVHSSEPQFFDLSADPKEARNLIEARAADARRYLEALHQLSALPALGEARTDPGARPDLAALGYVTGATPDGDLPAPHATLPRPSPQSRARSHARCIEAQSLAARRQLPAAVAILEEIAAREPDNWFALDLLAGFWMTLGRVGDAHGLLERMAQQGPPWGKVWFKLGMCRKAAGNLSGTIEALERAYVLDPSQAQCRQMLIESLRAAGRTAEAERYALPAAPAK